jgi:tripartite-type tricarboxylate transporter receptor subunit TctC
LEFDCYRNTGHHATIIYRPIFKWGLQMITAHLLRHLSQGLLLALSVLSGDRNANAELADGIRIVVAGGPGSPPDVISRMVAAELSQNNAWRVTVENRPGALSTLAIGDVLRQPADGRTIITMDLPMAAAPALFPGLDLRVETDFAPVIKLSKQYNVLVVNPSVPARSVAELVAALKSQPDKFNFSSGPFGTPAHLIGEMFKLQTGVRATHVPYPGPQQRLPDLIGGITQFDFLTTSLAVDLIATGKLRALAVTAPKRIAALKDVSTVVEQGFPDLVVEDWVGFAVKNGTSNEFVTRLNESVNTALAKQKIRDAFAALGAEPVGGTPTELGLFVKSQVAHWGKVVRDAGIKMPR